MNTLGVSSIVISSVVVVEGAVCGIRQVLVSRLAIFGILINLINLACTCLLFIPRIVNERRSIRAVHTALASAAAVEAAIAWSEGDHLARDRSAFLMLTFAKSVVVATSSRYLSHHTGLMDSPTRFCDFIASELRHRASRYKLRSCSTVAIVVVALYTLTTSESITSPSPLVRAIARAQLTRAAAATALVASLGSEDLSRRGPKKEF